MRSTGKRNLSDWAGSVSCLAIVALTAYRSRTLAVVPLLVPDTLRAIAFLIRGQKFAILPGLWPRIASYVGSYTAVVLFDSMSYLRPQWTAPNSGPIAAVGILFLLLSTVPTAWAIWHLRHSFSIEPQARTLVTDGPYGVSRHPIYVLYFLQTFGILLSHRTIAVALVVLFSTTFQAIRMFYEERVLSRAFSEYADYRKQVDIFGWRALRRSIKSLMPSAGVPLSHVTRN